MANISFHTNSPVAPVGATKISLSHHNFAHFFESASSVVISSPGTTTINPTVTSIASQMMNGKITTIPGSVVRTINLADSKHQIFAKRINGQTTTLTPIISNGTTVTTTGGNVITLHPIKASTAASASSGTILTSTTSASSNSNCTNSGNNSNVVIYKINADSSDPHCKSNTVLLSSDGNILSTMGSIKFITSTTALSSGSSFTGYPDTSADIKPVIIYPKVSNVSSGTTNSGSASTSNVAVKSSTKSGQSSLTPKKAKLDIPVIIKEEITNNTVTTPLLSSGTTNKLVETTNDQSMDVKPTIKTPEMAKPISKSNIENVLPSPVTNGYRLNLLNHWSSSSRSAKHYSLNSISQELPDDIFDTDEEDFVEDEQPFKSTFTFNSNLFSTTTNVSSTHLNTATCNLPNLPDSPNDDVKKQEEEMMQTEGNIIKSEEEEPLVIDGNSVVKKKCKTKGTSPTKATYGSSLKSIKVEGKTRATKAKKKVSKKPLTREQIQAKRLQIWKSLLKEVVTRRDKIAATRIKAMENRKYLAMQCKASVNGKLGMEVIPLVAKQEATSKPEKAGKDFATENQMKEPKTQAKSQAKAKPVQLQKTQVVVVPASTAPPTAATVVPVASKPIVTPTVVMVTKRKPSLTNGSLKKPGTLVTLTSMPNGGSATNSGIPNGTKVIAIKLHPDQAKNLPFFLTKGQNGKNCKTITIQPTLLNGAKVISTGPISARKVVAAANAATSRQLVQRISL